MKVFLVAAFRLLAISYPVGQDRLESVTEDTPKLSLFSEGVLDQKSSWGHLGMSGSRSSPGGHDSFRKIWPRVTVL